MSLTETERSEMSQNLHERALSAQTDGEYENAKKIHTENLKIRREIGDKKSLSDTLHNLGFISHELGDIEDARKFYEESLRLCEELGCKEGISENLKRIAFMEHDLDNIKTAYNCYQKCLKMKEEIGDKSTMLDLLHRAGHIAYILHNNDDAISHYKKMLDIGTEFSDKEACGMALAQLHIILVENRKKFEGLMLLLCAHEIFMSIESNHFVDTSHAIDEFKNAGYEERILSIQGSLNISSFEEIIKTARETIHSIDM